VFYSLRSDYAKIKVLGVSSSELTKQIVFEVIVMVFIIALASSITLILLIPNLGPLMLFLKYYKDIQTDVPTMLFRVLLGSSAFILSYGSYIFKARHLDMIQEIKKY
jgi:ABC-type antimicrobial peptide transport system permease subunit